MTSDTETATCVITTSEDKKHVIIELEKEEFQVLELFIDCKNDNSNSLSINNKLVFRKRDGIVREIHTSNGGF